ncbi:ABC transporter [Micromonospora yangpuensis]|uniref:ABC transporter n=1 Tax=Micromonospora yangpuensis TaxID=683228 RepID=A0A1C6UWC1_9ACTN|nr:ABC transporter [Micromonospora yangpuensis]
MPLPRGGRRPPGRLRLGQDTLALALLGHQRPGLHLRSGRLRVFGTDPFRPEGRALRGQVVSFLGQDPAAALNPARRLGAQLAEAAGPGRVTELLATMDLPTDHAFTRRRPHQISGGQAQRVALAIAIAGNPRLLILDEPTSGLDEPLARDLRERLTTYLRDRDCAALVITHTPPWPRPWPTGSSTSTPDAWHPPPSTPTRRRFLAAAARGLGGGGFQPGDRPGHPRRHGRDAAPRRHPRPRRQPAVRRRPLRRAVPGRHGGVRTRPLGPPRRHRDVHRVRSREPTAADAGAGPSLVPLPVACSPTAVCRSPPTAGAGGAGSTRQPGWPDAPCSRSRPLLVRRPRPPPPCRSPRRSPPREPQSTAPPLARWKTSGVRGAATQTIRPVRVPRRRHSLLRCPTPDPAV